MCERHGACGNHHQHTEHTLDRIEVIFLLDLGIRLDPVDRNCTDHSDDHGDSDSHEVRVAKRDTQTDVLEPLQDCNQRNSETGEKYVYRYEKLGTRQRVFLPQDQSLHTQIDQECDKPCGDRRYDPAHDDRADFLPVNRIYADTYRGKTHDRADDGMGRRNRPAFV